MCERRYRVGEQWYNLRPDARAAYRMGSQHFRFWLEWDRGTMNARDLLVKCSSYAHYIAWRQWGKRAINAASASLHSTRYCAGAAYQTYSPNETHAHSRVGTMDDDRGALERVWTMCIDLVAADSGGQSRWTARWYAQADNLCSGS